MRRFTLILLFVGIACFSVGFLTMMDVTVPHYQPVLDRLQATNIQVMGGAFVAIVVGFVMIVMRG